MKIYLAIPYTGQEQESFEMANKIAGELMLQGYEVFSPISHTHPIACVMVNPPEGTEFWLFQDVPFIEWCDEVWVADFKDWRKSKGVCTEIAIAKAMGKPIRFMGRRGLEHDNENIPA